MHKLLVCAVPRCLAINLQLQDYDQQWGNIRDKTVVKKAVMRTAGLVLYGKCTLYA
jgi:hypothetical protein